MFSTWFGFEVHVAKSITKKEEKKQCITVSHHFAPVSDTSLKTKNT